jgi:hypothetical protein
MAEKTFHVYRAEDGHWAVGKAGVRSKTFPSQYQAVKAARHAARGERESQVVVHERDGKLVVKELHGFPSVQNPPRKSSLGTARISKVISDSVRKRLENA